jgi:hypothetical protein
MKKTSVLRFTRKCLKLGYKEKVCSDAWIFGKTPTPELTELYALCFKGEKTYTWPHPIKSTRKLKHSKPPTKITKKMILEAAGPRFV